MLLSRGTQYTLQALIFLARQADGRMVLVREMADQLGIPLFYLGKLIQPIARAGWLITARGRCGGVRLRPGAESVTLGEILQITDGHRLMRECLLGFKACEDETACVLHCQWKPIKQELSEGLGHFSLANMATSGTELPAWLLGEQ